MRVSEKYSLTTPAKESATENNFAGEEEKKIARYITFLLLPPELGRHRSHVREKSNAGLHRKDKNISQQQHWKKELRGAKRLSFQKQSLT